MTTLRTIATASIFILGLTGCINQLVKPESTVVSKAGTGMEEMLPAYSGPRARVAVTDFEWNTGKSETTIGIGGTEFSFSQDNQSAHADALKDMLTTALVQSKRYRVLERQRIGSIKQEIGLQEEGFTDASGVAKGSIQGSDIIVVAAITGWAPASSGRSGSLGANLLGGKAGALFGAIKGGYSKSSMSMDIRIIDAKTSEVLAATNVQTEATDVNFGAALGALTGGSSMDGALGSYAKTPMEKVIRSAILESTKYIATNTPAEYMIH